MGGELGGPGGFVPRFRPLRTRGVLFTSAWRPNGGPGACPGLVG